VGVVPEQAIPQLVPLHDGMPVPAAGPGQAEHDVVPHEAVLVLLEHVPPQSCVPLGHVHFPEAQCLPPVHANDAPHPPQLLSSLLSSTHAPAHGTYPSDVWHAYPHIAVVHVGDACATLVVQTWLHVPQLFWSVCLLVQVMPQRSGVVPVHVDAHISAWQSGVGFEHVTPHPPQLPFCERSLGQPLPASAQSEKPVAQE
jgi:hypothetical protein